MPLMNVLRLMPRRGVSARPLRPCVGRWLLLPALSCAFACTPAAGVVGPGPDVPVPASEPRGSVTYRLDLEPGAACEQHFDLALYADRGIDLIRWDDSRNSCRGRVVHIRYLSKKLDARRVRALVDAHALKAQELAK